MAAARVHLVGIGGTGMGSLAGLFKAQGWAVQGSDTAVFPPMSDQLAALGIPVSEGFSAAHLMGHDGLVVVGNIARPDNPEAAEARRLGLPVTSMSAALAEHFLATRQPLVVAGTHGKTTTSALLAWGLAAAGRDPGFFIGGVLRNFDATASCGTGREFVVEGDEYETAFFDRHPKFLHYRPHTAILTSIELDHMEVFPRVEVLVEAFERFVDLLPADGRLIACADDPLVAQVCAASKAPVTYYGTTPGASVRAEAVVAGPEGTTFDMTRDGRPHGTFHSPLSGRHNLLNAVAALEAMAGVGVDGPAAALGLASFAGVRRRQEVRGEVDGVVVLDDFAHHPTAVRETLRGLRSLYPGRRLVAVFEPRTNTSRRSIFQADYEAALGEADRVLVAAVHLAERAPAGDRLDPEAICAGLRQRGIDAIHLPRAGDIIADLARHSRPGDVITVMSNGAFEDLHSRLLAALAERAAGDAVRPAR